jgi:hypothetical protein
MALKKIPMGSSEGKAMAPHSDSFGIESFQIVHDLIRGLPLGRVRRKIGMESSLNL